MIMEPWRFTWNLILYTLLGMILEENIRIPNNIGTNCMMSIDQVSFRTSAGVSATAQLTVAMMTSTLKTHTVEKPSEYSLNKTIGTAPSKRKSTQNGSSSSATDQSIVEATGTPDTDFSSVPTPLLTEASAIAPQSSTGPRTQMTVGSISNGRTVIAEDTMAEEQPMDGSPTMTSFPVASGSMGSAGTQPLSHLYTTQQMSSQPYPAMSTTDQFPAAIYTGSKATDKEAMDKKSPLTLPSSSGSRTSLILSKQTSFTDTNAIITDNSTAYRPGTIPSMIPLKMTLTPSFWNNNQSRDSSTQESTLTEGEISMKVSNSVAPSTNIAWTVGTSATTFLKYEIPGQTMGSEISLQRSRAPAPEAATGSSTVAGPEVMETARTARDLGEFSSILLPSSKSSLSTSTELLTHLTTTKEMSSQSSPEISDSIPSPAAKQTHTKKETRAKQEVSHVLPQSGSDFYTSVKVSTSSHSGWTSVTSKSARITESSTLAQPSIASETTPRYTTPPSLLSTTSSRFTPPGKGVNLKSKLLLADSRYVAPSTNVVLTTDIPAEAFSQTSIMVRALRSAVSPLRNKTPKTNNASGSSTLGSKGEREATMKIGALEGLASTPPPSSVLSESSEFITEFHSNMSTNPHITEASIVSRHATEMDETPQYVASAPLLSSNLNARRPTQERTSPREKGSLGTTNGQLAAASTLPTPTESSTASVADHLAQATGGYTGSLSDSRSAVRAATHSKGDRKFLKTSPESPATSAGTMVPEMSTGSRSDIVSHGTPRHMTPVHTASGTPRAANLTQQELRPKSAGTQETMSRQASAHSAAPVVTASPSILGSNSPPGSPASASIWKSALTTVRGTEGSTTAEAASDLDSSRTHSWVKGAPAAFSDFGTAPVAGVASKAMEDHTTSGWVSSSTPSAARQTQQKLYVEDARIQWSTTGKMPATGTLAFTMELDTTTTPIFGSEATQANAALASASASSNALNAVSLTQGTAVHSAQTVPPGMLFTTTESVTGTRTSLSVSDFGTAPMSDVLSKAKGNHAISQLISSSTLSTTQENTFAKGARSQGSTTGKMPASTTLAFNMELGTATTPTFGSETARANAASASASASSNALNTGSLTPVRASSDGARNGVSSGEQMVASGMLSMTTDTVTGMRTSLSVPDFGVAPVAGIVSKATGNHTAPHSVSSAMASAARPMRGEKHAEGARNQGSTTGKMPAATTLAFKMEVGTATTSAFGSEAPQSDTASASVSINAPNAASLAQVTESSEAARDGASSAAQLVPAGVLSTTTESVTGPRTTLSVSNFGRAPVAGAASKATANHTTSQLVSSSTPSTGRPVQEKIYAGSTRTQGSTTGTMPASASLAFNTELGTATTPAFGSEATHAHTASGSAPSNTPNAASLMQVRASSEAARDGASSAAQLVPAGVLSTTTESVTGPRTTLSVSNFGRAPVAGAASKATANHTTSQLVSSSTPSTGRPVQEKIYAGSTRTQGSTTGTMPASASLAFNTELGTATTPAFGSEATHAHTASGSAPSNTPNAASLMQVRASSEAARDGASSAAQLVPAGVLSTTTESVTGPRTTLSVSNFGRAPVAGAASKATANHTTSQLVSSSTPSTGRPVQEKIYAGSTRTQGSTTGTMPASASLAFNTELGTATTPAFGSEATHAHTASGSAPSNTPNADFGTAPMAAVASEAMVNHTTSRSFSSGTPTSVMPVQEKTFAEGKPTHHECSASTSKPTDEDSSLKTAVIVLAVLFCASLISLLAIFSLWPYMKNKTDKYNIKLQASMQNFAYQNL